METETKEDYAQWYLTFFHVQRIVTILIEIWFQLSLCFLEYSPIIVKNSIVKANIILSHFNKVKFA